MANTPKKYKGLKGKRSVKTAPKEATPYSSPTVSNDDSDPLNPLLNDLINSKPNTISKPIRLNNTYAEWLAEEAVAELEPTYKRKSNRRIADDHEIDESAL